MIKDWKMIAKRVNGEFYENKKTLQKLVIIKILPSGFAITTNGKIVRSFKTHSQAISFAKSYMRKN